MLVTPLLANTPFIGHPNNKRKGTLFLSKKELGTQLRAKLEAQAMDDEEAAEELAAADRAAPRQFFEVN